MLIFLLTSFTKAESESPFLPNHYSFWNMFWNKDMRDAQRRTDFYYKKRATGLINQLRRQQPPNPINGNGIKANLQNRQAMEKNLYDSMRN